MADRREVFGWVQRLIEAETTMVLATVGELSEPEAVSLFYWSDKSLRLYWLSATESRHSRNLEIRPLAAVTVHANVRRWQEIRGVQMEGTAAAVVEQAERERVLVAYRERFQLGEEMDTAIAQSTLYVFRPSWLRYLDNSHGFGFKVELDLPGGRVDK